MYTNLAPVDVMTTKDKSSNDKRKAILMKMIENGQQIPLNKLLDPKCIFNLRLSSHAVSRYKKRFEKLYLVQIEQEMKNALFTSAMVVEKGHSDRILVHAKGFIFVMDENVVYTIYDANGNDKNNILDPTKAQLKKIERKTRHLSKIDRLFETINNNNKKQTHCFS